MWVLIMIVMLGNSEAIENPVKNFETELECYTHLSKLELSYKNSQFDPPVLKCKLVSKKAT
tara:strand:+ start:1402 stop:1584 length:183 start_codon:yes stop_codon:yes gene_type:complete